MCPNLSIRLHIPPLQRTRKFTSSTELFISYTTCHINLSLCKQIQSKVTSNETGQQKNRYLAIKGYLPWKNLKPPSECVGEADNTAKQPAARQVGMQNTLKQTQSITKAEFDLHFELNITHNLCPQISNLPQVSLTSVGYDVHRHTSDHLKWTRAASTLCNWSDQAVFFSAVFSTDRVEHREASSTLLSHLPSLNTSRYNPFIEKQSCACREKPGCLN